MAENLNWDLELASNKGCSPWGREESDATERLHFHFSLSCIGEGNGNPLQCSCLENPRDRGTWWAAIYGVTQSPTRLKQLSSSRFIIAFLPRSKCLNFMVAVTVCSDFGAQENKICHCFHFFPIYLPWSDGTRCRILDWIPIPFRGSSQPRNRTRVSSFAGGFFTSWAIREALEC